MYTITPEQAHTITQVIVTGLQVTKITAHPHSGAVTLYGKADGYEHVTELLVIGQDGHITWRRAE